MRGLHGPPLRRDLDHGVFAAYTAGTLGRAFAACGCQRNRLVRIRIHLQFWQEAYEQAMWN